MDMVPGTDVKLEDRYVVRQTDQQTDTDMQTDRQLLIWYLVKMSNSGTDMWSYRPTDRHTDRQTAMDMVPGKDVKLKDGDVVGQTGRQTYRQTDRPTDRHTDRQAGRPTDRHTHRQAGKQTDTQTGRQTQTDSYGIWYLVKMSNSKTEMWSVQVKSMVALSAVDSSPEPIG